MPDRPLFFTPPPPGYDVEPLTPPQVHWLDEYMENRNYSGMEVYCADCGSTVRCCKNPPPEPRSWLRRIFNRPEEG